MSHQVGLVSKSPRIISWMTTVIMPELEEITKAVSKLILLPPIMANLKNLDILHYFFELVYTYIYICIYI